MTDMRWCIYYVDGTRFDNTDGAPEDAPGWGVAAVVQADSVIGAAVHHQHDFYFFAQEFGGWYACDIWGASQYFARPGTKIVKLGDVMPTEAYRALVESLHADPKLPHKSARYDWERTDG